MPNQLVSAEWLQSHLSDTDLRVLDASYHLPTAQRNADLEFIEGHIPGAVRFDIDEIKDLNDPLPHMLPSAAEFDAAMQDLGVGAEMQIVVYDTQGLFSAARAWWMFRYFGHDRVAVLDGGLPAWQASGGTLESGRGRVFPPKYPFKSKSRAHWVVTADEILAGLDSTQHTILDARARPRFVGEVEEPRPGMRSGHIPGSHNVPFSSLLDAETSMLLPKAELEARFSEFELDQTQVVVSCGSGVTACVLALAMDVIGLSEPKLYDGSWSEWGSQEGWPVETG
jgi:thiosulfate/3-mercaptopyruvate sulfurtransferase